MFKQLVVINWQAKTNLKRYKDLCYNIFQPTKLKLKRQKILCLNFLLSECNELCLNSDMIQRKSIVKTTKDRKLLRVMIIHVLKRYGILKN